MCLYCHSSVLIINCHLFDLYSIDVLKYSTSFFLTHPSLCFSSFIEIVLFYVHYAYFYCKPSRILLLSLFTWTSCVFPKIMDCLFLHFLNFLLPYFSPHALCYLADSRQYYFPLLSPQAWARAAFSGSRLYCSSWDLCWQPFWEFLSLSSYTAWILSLWGLTLFSWRSVASWERLHWTHFNLFFGWGSIFIPPTHSMFGNVFVHSNFLKKFSSVHFFTDFFVLISGILLTWSWTSKVDV